MQTRALAVLILGLALAALAWESRAVRPQIDDAYISYRYARNWVDGQGLVFNPGERVEGMTNLAWTLAIGTGMALGFDAPLVGHVLGCLSGALMLLCVYMLASVGVDPGRRWLCALATLPVLASSSFATWVPSGLETPLFAALVTAALWAQCRDRMGWATAAAVAATLTRPDGVLVAVAIYAPGVLRRWRSPLGWLRTRSDWGPVVVYACAILLLTAFRMAYYGSPVPNTFYAKVGGIPMQRGVVYALGFLLDGAALLLLPLPFALSRCKQLLPGLGYSLLLLVYTVYVGGDVFKNGRFLLPCLPFLAAAAAIGVDAAFRRRQELGLALLVTLPAASLWPLYGAGSLPLLAAAILVAVAAADRVRGRLGRAPLIGATLVTLLVIVGMAIASRDRGDEPGAGFPMSARRQEARVSNFLPDGFVARQARLVAEADPPVRLVAHPAIGRFGYYSGVPILDILGLVDAHIARSGAGERAAEEGAPSGGARSIPGHAAIVPGHQRSDSDYVFSRRPDFIFIPKRDPAYRGILIPAVADLWRGERLDALYEYNARLRAYERRDRRG